MQKTSGNAPGRLTAWKAYCLEGLLLGRLTAWPVGVLCSLLGALVVHFAGL